MTTSSSAPDKVKPILIDLVSPSPDKNCVKTGLGLRSCSKDRRIKDLNTIIANLKRSIATKTSKNEPKLLKSIQKLRDQVKTYEAKLYEIQSVEERSSSDSDLENLLKQSELAFKTVIETGLANVNRSLASTLNRESTSTPINPPILDPLDPADDLFDEASVEGDNDHRHNSFLSRVNISDLSSIEIPKDSDSSEESDNSTHSNIILNFGNMLTLINQ